jgi:hypothetical protein
VNTTIAQQSNSASHGESYSRFCPNLESAYSARQRVGYLVAATILGVVVAGFWNFRLVDGFGSEVVASNIIGGYQGKAAAFETLGADFGFVFAVVAGLAATFTACNCVAFAFLPGLVCARDYTSDRSWAGTSLGVMLCFVLLTSATYGVFVGLLGPSGAAAINLPVVRFAQATVVFSVIGVAMLLWGAIEFGVLRAFAQRCSLVTRTFFSQPTTKAALVGIMIGCFPIGRPYPVFREFLLYAAQTGKPGYTAAVMALQGVSQIAVMLGAFVAVMTLFGKPIRSWARVKSHQATLLSAFALVLGGSFFVFYWGIARIWPLLGRWGFQLGWYG